MSDRPRVSVIVTAYNLARFLPSALDSALAQESPGGPVQIVVVDDGSTDDTPAVLAGYADRVEVIRRPNGGLVAAVNTGLAAVRGEFIALLDADDEWPVDRLRRHVEILDANPLLGLVHGDMEVIDVDGTTLHPSFFAWKQEEATDGRILPRLIKDNFISGGASTFRASLLPAIHPIAAEAAYPDWWIATNIAAVAEIVYDPGCANRYRYHGANMGLGADGPTLLAIERRELPFRRWMMRNLIADDTITLPELAETYLRWRGALAHAGRSNHGTVRGTLEGDVAAAARELTAAFEHPIGRERCNALIRALAANPFDGATGTDLEIALMEATRDQRGVLEPAPPMIALESHPRLTIGWLDELVQQPSLLHGFAVAALADEGASLAILTVPGTDLAPLVALVEADPIFDDERCDLQIVAEPVTTPARRLLAARSCAVLSGRAVPEPYAQLPLHAAALQAAPAAALAA